MCAPDGGADTRRFRRASGWLGISSICRACADAYQFLRCRAPGSSLADTGYRIMRRRMKYECILRPTVLPKNIRTLEAPVRDRGSAGPCRNGESPSFPRAERDRHRDPGSRMRSELVRGRHAASPLPRPTVPRGMPRAPALPGSRASELPQASVRPPRGPWRSFAAPSSTPPQSSRARSAARQWPAGIRPTGTADSFSRDRRRRAISLPLASGASGRLRPRTAQLDSPSQAAPSDPRPGSSR